MGENTRNHQPFVRATSRERAASTHHQHRQRNTIRIHTSSQSYRDDGRLPYLPTHSISNPRLQNAVLLHSPTLNEKPFEIEEIITHLRSKIISNYRTQNEHTWLAQQKCEKIAMNGVCMVAKGQFLYLPFRYPKKKNNFIGKLSRNYISGITKLNIRRRKKVHILRLFKKFLFSTLFLFFNPFSRPGRYENDYNLQLYVCLGRATAHDQSTFCNFTERNNDIFVCEK